MPVTSIKFVRSSKLPMGAFRVNLAWEASVSAILLAACPSGEALGAEDLVASVRAGARPDKLNAKICPKGIDACDFCPASLSGRWVDLHAFDLDAAGGVIRRDAPRRAFFGECEIGYRIKPPQRVSAGLRSVRITLENRSVFAVPAHSLGYKVGTRLYAIPVELREGQRLTLPQIEIPPDQTLQLVSMTDGIPAVFGPLDR